ncbi:hypothetical protein D9611_008344 [Ephemerocybe angulata]|uniref:F-box domain-containing protein n=1 Tax=Ephemerocybe angulata TaxID=980116 RepID=A0A8H5F549_9AGAR|nr:hypothetical protein D9611_008344 [Tulosesus angulatus]
MTITRSVFRIQAIDDKQGTRSPFESVLNTNYVPSEEECRNIEGYLETLRIGLSRLEDQARIVREATEGDIGPDLELEELKLFIAAHCALLSPARRLPDDILREVFLNCLPPNHNATFSPADSPVLLTHVSNRWRDVAFSTPRLWSTLHIPLLSRLLDYSSNRMSTIKEWMARSGSVPLSLSFGTLPVALLPTIPDIGLLLSVLSPALTRLENMSITLRGRRHSIFKKLIQSLEKKRRNPFRRVPKLELYIDLAAIPNARLLTRLECDGILSALHLEDNMHLKDLTLSTSFSLATLPNTMKGPHPWSNLESLRIQPHRRDHNENGLVRSIICDVLLDVLALCPNLKLLEARCSQFQELPIPGREAVTLPKLKHVSLSLAAWKNLHVVDFLAKCDWPVLSSLHLCVEEIEGPVNVLSALTDRYGPRLTTLQFTFPNMPKGYLGKLIFELPNLLQLHLHHEASAEHEIQLSDEEEDGGSDSGGFEEHFGDGLLSVFSSFEPVLDDELLAVLTPKGAKQARPYVCPCLQYLRLEGGTSFSTEGILGLLRMRSTSPSGPFKQLYTTFRKGAAHDRLRKECADLVEAGLDLQLVNPELEVTGGPGYSLCKANLPLDDDPFALGWQPYQ